MTMKNAVCLMRSMSLPFALDMIERAVAATFLIILSLRLIHAYMETGTSHYLILIFSEYLVVGFIIFRRTTNDVSLKPTDWCIAIAGTTLPMLVIPGGTPLVPGAVSGLLMLVGIATSIWAKTSLRCSFGVVAANRGVKTRGPYNFVRHPMYFGYLLTHIGYLISNPTWWNFVIYAATLIFQILRMSAEEYILSKDIKYKTYAANIRHRLIPGIF